MPYKAARPCSHPGCPNLVRKPGRRYCEEHQKEEWRKESKERVQSGTHADYGPRWIRIRKRFLRANPICARCGHGAEVVHHIVPREKGGSDDPSNLVSLCRSCHSKVHAEAGDYF